MSNINTEKIKTDVDGDSLHITVGLYKFFLANDALDALKVYIHLMFTARLQATNQVWAKDSYLRKGCGIGQAKIKAAKKFLAERGLITYVREKPKEGKPTMGEVYIRLNFDRKAKQVEEKNRILYFSIEQEDSSTGSISTPVEINTCRDRTQMLKKKKINTKERKEEKRTDRKVQDFKNDKLKKGEKPPPLFDDFYNIRMQKYSGPGDLEVVLKQYMNEIADLSEKHGKIHVLAAYRRYIDSNEHRLVKACKPARWFYQDIDVWLRQDRQESRNSEWRERNKEEIALAFGKPHKCKAPPTERQKEQNVKAAKRMVDEVASWSNRENKGKKTKKAVVASCEHCGKEIRKERNELISHCKGCGHVIAEIVAFKQQRSKEIEKRAANE